MAESDLDLTEPNTDELQQTTTQRVYKQPFVSALGLDLGRKRIGVAGCDGTGLIATGLTTIERKHFAADLAQLQSFVRDRRVQVLVVGLPYSMDGSVGKQATQIQNLAQRYAQALRLPLEYVDERLTSFQAEQLLIAQKISPSRNKALIDRKAAAIILQQWLDARRQSTRSLATSQTKADIF